MQWWCSARGIAWDWTWRPYVGVWIVIALLAVGYVWLSRIDRAERDTAPGRRRGWLYWLGLFALWLALDWPIGALGGGYLASAHMLQFLLVALVAPLFLELGLPAAAFDRLAQRPTALGVMRTLTHPLFALIVFNAVLVFTHHPRIVDAWMRTQPGSFGIDALWFAAGLIFWWPVVCPVPERPRFPDLARMGYLFGNTIIAGFLALILVFAGSPVYGIYELAPPVGWISSRDDQQVAGILMKIGGAVILWAAMSVIFFRWYRRENPDPETTVPGPPSSRTGVRG
jgi:cytochrome c oxidase assembly factor CtaG